MLKGSFKFKIIVPTVAVLIVLVLALNYILYARLTAVGNALIHEKLLSVTNGLNYYLEESAGKTNVAALTMAHNAEVVDAVRQKDTAALVRLCAPACALYLIDYFTVTDADGNVLARTYEPEAYGDSVLNQQNIKDALAGKVSTYFESGTLIKVSARTGAPVYDPDGKIVGAVSAGVRFDSDSKVEALKNLFESEVTVFYGDTRIATTILIDGSSIAGTALDPAIAEVVLEQKQPYSGDVALHGEKFKTYYKPLLNAENEAFAALLVGIPLKNLIAETNHSIQIGILLGLCGLVLSTLLLYVMISNLSQPITKLSSDLGNIADGNLGIEIEVKGNDEVGSLGRSLQRVADTLYKLLAEINKTIAEHEKGNLDYFLNTEEFLGDYKTLANNITELSAFGLRDQLTGIPNRRAFDNRLEGEWNRCMRERNPISIMMLDADKFKNYNDTFGHQQGDLALKTIATTIKQTIKRPSDFFARWGGEEFVVLLAATDAAGAAVLAEQIRAAIDQATIPCQDERGAKITVSIGVNTMVPTREANLKDFLETADAALYQAKETGRNRVSSLETQ